MKKTRFVIPTAVIFGLAAFMAGSTPVKIELPPETTAFKFAPGAEIANGQCLICHSVEYVSTQPPMPKAFWAGSVKKMQDKYGAPIAPEQVEALVEYLTQNYGVSTNAPATTPRPAVQPTASGATGSQIAMKYACLTCHSVSAKIIGPAYKDIAAKYKTDADAKAKVAEQIHKGGSGKWGPVLMPPFPQVTEEETKVLTEWILSRN